MPALIRTLQHDGAAAAVEITSSQTGLPGAWHCDCAALAALPGSDHLHLGASLLPGRFPTRQPRGGFTAQPAQACLDLDDAD